MSLSGSPPVPSNALNGTGSLGLIETVKPSGLLMKFFHLCDQFLAEAFVAAGEVFFLGWRSPLFLSLLR